MHIVNGCTRGDGTDVYYQPGRVPDRLGTPVAHRVPVSPLMGDRPGEMPDPSDDDLRTLTQASRW